MPCIGSSAKDMKSKSRERYLVKNSIRHWRSHGKNPMLDIFDIGCSRLHATQQLCGLPTITRTRAGSCNYWVVARGRRDIERVVQGDGVGIEHQQVGGRFWRETKSNGNNVEQQRCVWLCTVNDQICSAIGGHRLICSKH